MNIAPGRVAHHFISRLGWALALLLGFASGCVEETTRPQDQDDELVLPALTSPENVIVAMQIIYNETHSAEDRWAGYASLLDSAFVFHFQRADINSGLPASWGLEDELAAHAGIFAAQSANQIYSIELLVIHNPADDLSPPEDGREGWQEIFATNVYLRLMLNPERWARGERRPGRVQVPASRERTVQDRRLDGSTAAGIAQRRFG